MKTIVVFVLTLLVLAAPSLAVNDLTIVESLDEFKIINVPWQDWDLIQVALTLESEHWRVSCFFGDHSAAVYVNKDGGVYDEDFARATTQILYLMSVIQPPLAMCDWAYDREDCSAMLPLIGNRTNFPSSSSTTKHFSSIVEALFASPGVKVKKVFLYYEPIN